MAKLKPSDFTQEHINLMCKIINAGNQVEVKKERDSVVIVEIRRSALVKSPIED